MTLFSLSRQQIGIVIAMLIAICALVAPMLLNRTTDLPTGIGLPEYQEAERRFREHYRRAPDRFDVVSLLGETAVAEERLETAVNCFAAIPTENAKYGMSARFQEGQVFLKLNRATEAERCFRQFLEPGRGIGRTSVENTVAAQKWLAYILTVELRFEERRQLLAEVQASDLADVFDSKQYHFPNLLIWNSAAGRSRLSDFLKGDPDNTELLIARGRYLTAEGRLDEAATLLKQLREKVPTNQACLAALLECYFERSDWAAMLSLSKGLPEYKANEPWLLTRMRAELAAHDSDWQQAIDFYQLVLKGDPASPWCQMGLARAYGALGRGAEREQALQRALVLSKIRVNLINVNEDNAQAARELAVLCKQCGLTDAEQTFRRHAARIGQAKQQPPAISN